MKQWITICASLDQPPQACMGGSTGQAQVHFPFPVANQVRVTLSPAPQAAPSIPLPESQRGEPSPPSTLLPSSPSSISILTHALFLFAAPSSPPLCVLPVDFLSTPGAIPVGLLAVLSRVVSWSWPSAPLFAAFDVFHVSCCCFHRLVKRWSST